MQQQRQDAMLASKPPKQKHVEQVGGSRGGSGTNVCIWQQTAGVSGQMGAMRRKEDFC